MKETLVKVIALLGLVAILGLAACGVDPSVSSSATTSSVASGTSSSAGSAVWTGPKITISVILLPTATNLFDSAYGTNNDVYIVGTFSNLALASDTNVRLKDWTPADINAKMSFLSNVGGLPVYQIVLANDLASPKTIYYKLVNGSPSFGGGWGSVEKGTNGGEIQDPERPTFDILVGSNVINERLGTTVHLDSNGSVVGSMTNDGVQKWATVAATYTVTNINAVIVLTNVYATNTVAGLTNNLGDPFYIAGHIKPGDSSAWINSGTNAATAGTWIYTISNYYGGATIDFQGKSPQFGNAAYDNGGNNFTFSFKPTDVGTTVYITNTGSWRTW